MPRTHIDYSKIIIYKIICNDANITELYVGSTTLFKRRKTQHKYICNNITDKSYCRKIYETIRANGGWDNWTMLEIEKFPCVDGNEARARERYYFDLLNASLNSYRPIVTKDETYKLSEKNKRILRDKDPEKYELSHINKNKSRMERSLKLKAENYELSF